MVSSRRGVFVTFEGPDGSGKSTQIKRLAARLRRAGCACLLTREPGGGGPDSLPEKIRALVLSHRRPAPTAETELLLFLAARAQHVHDLIAPALARGRVVLCERFADATFAYQVGGRGLAPTFVRAANRFAAGGLRPDLTLLLDVPSREGLRRAFRAKTGHDRIEAEAVSFHRRVRAAYLRLARQEPGRVRVIAAQGSEDLVAEQIWKVVQTRLRKAGCRAV